MTRPGLFGGLELAYEGLCEEEGTLEVDVEDGVVVGFGDVDEVRVLLDARVVDEDVAGAKLLPRLLDEVGAVGEVGDVGVDQNGFASSSGDLVRCGLRLVNVVAVVDDAVRAFLREALGDGLADARTRTCDDGDFSFKTCGHDYLLAFFVADFLLAGFFADFLLADFFAGALPSFSRSKSLAFSRVLMRSEERFLPARFS